VLVREALHGVAQLLQLLLVRRDDGLLALRELGL
jgi:hypothetical protein